MSRVQKSNVPLAQRSRAVLFATIAEYVSTGRPVSSAAIAKNHGLRLSPATIRRELLQLDERGLLVQPHTSAGRVPTDRAFRIFADTLKDKAGQLDAERRTQLTKGLGQVLPGESRSWQDAVRLLSDLSYQAALVVTPALADTVLKQLRFIPCGPGSLLAVIVTREGLVHNAYVEPPEKWDDRELERIHNYLGELVEGRTLTEIRRIMRIELEDARNRCDALREKAAVLGQQAIRSSVQRTSELVVEGRRHLIGKPELTDRMEALLRVLEEKTRILALLDRAAATDRGPIVIIGKEGGESFDGCAMITAPFGDLNATGQVGVIGSKLMDYSAVIPLVALAAQFLSNQLQTDDT